MQKTQGFVVSNSSRFKQTLMILMWLIATRANRVVIELDQQLLDWARLCKSKNALFVTGEMALANQPRTIADSTQALI